MVDENDEHSEKGKKLSFAPYFFFILGWLIPISLAAYGLTLEGFPYQNTAIGAAGLILLFFLINVRAPNIIRGFFLGHFVGKMPFKVAVGIPGLLQLEPLEIRWIDAFFKDDDIYLVTDNGEAEYAEVEGLIQFRQNVDAKSLEESLQMPPDEMQTQLIAVGKTLSHQMFGQKTIKEVNDNFENLEKEAKDTLKKEAGHYGYEVQDFQLDVKFPTVKIRADGRARGYAAKQISGHLQGNMPAAITSTAQTLADTAKEIVKMKSQSINPTPRQSVSGSEVTTGQQVGEVIDEILNRRQ